MTEESGHRVKSIGALFFTSFIFLSGFSSSHASERRPDDEKFAQSLASIDNNLIKITTALMASNQVLSCNLDMTLLGKSYREFYDLSEPYVEREKSHMDQFVDYTELLVNSEDFQQRTTATKTCEELLSIYGEILQQISNSSERILDIQNK